MQGPTQNNDDLHAFLARVQSSLTKPIGEALGTRISQANRDAILKLVMDENNVINLSRLNNNEALHFAKEDTGLKRTFSIIRSTDGTYKLLLETKSKLADDTKSKEKIKREGVEMHGKPCWRIDGEEEEYFNLVSTYGNIRELEIRFALSDMLGTNCESIAVYEMGPKFTKKGKSKAYLYSTKAIDTLKNMGDSIRQLPLSEQYSLILDMIKGVQKLHQHQYIHQDLHSENFLVYKKRSGNLHVKLIDINSGILTTGRSARAPTNASSPEIAYAHNDPSSFEYITFFTYYSNKIASYTSFSEPQYTYKTANQANDMWTLGITIFELLYNRKPLLTDEPLIQSNTLLKGLLEPKREKRISAEQAALVCHQFINDLPQYINDTKSIPSSLEQRDESFYLDFINRIKAQLEHYQHPNEIEKALAIVDEILFLYGFKNQSIANLCFGLTADLQSKSTQLSSPTTSFSGSKIAFMQAQSNFFTLLKEVAGITDKSNLTEEEILQGKNKCSDCYQKACSLDPRYKKMVQDKCLEDFIQLGKLEPRPQAKISPPRTQDGAVDKPPVSEDIEKQKYTKH